MPDLQPIRNGDSMSDWKEKINNVIEHVNTIDVTGQDWTFAGSFLAADFTDNNGFKQLRIPATTHGLGSIVTMKSFLRKVGQDYTNVIYSFKVYVNGTIIVLTHEAFDGKYIIEREV